MIKMLVRRAILASPLPEIMLQRKAARHLTLLAYHRVGDLPDRCYPFDQDLISATPEEFSKELRYLRKNLDLITVRELQAGLADPRCLPKRPAVITFDDGYADNYHIAFPQLKEAGLSACFFISSRLVGTANIPWWDQLACCFKNASAGEIVSPFGSEDRPYTFQPDGWQKEASRFRKRMKASPWPEALKYLEYLKAQTCVDPSDFQHQPLFCSWEQVREMADGGMEIGGHTRSHPVLGQIKDLAVLKEEIAGGCRDIAEHLGVSPTAFSYPEGNNEAMSPEADRIIADAGCTISFSYLPFLTPRTPQSPVRLPRVHLEYGDDFGAFRLGLSRSAGQ